MNDPLPPVLPAEGWHVLHLFYKIEYGQWTMSTADEQLRAKTNLSALIQEIRATPDTQLLTFAIVSPKADLGFLLLSPDLHVVNAFEKRLSLALGADVLTAVYSYLSLTERQEYAEVEASQALAQEQLYPVIPDLPVFCFYPLTRRRSDLRNWYALSLEERQRLITSQAKSVEPWSDTVFQMVTGSTGLEDDEWAVTLLAHSTSDIKKLVHTVRFDPLNAEYSEFGEIHVGLQLPLDRLFRRLQL